jgi:hypothetical protein
MLVFLCRGLRRCGLGGLLGCRHWRETEDGQDEKMSWFHVISVDTGDPRPAKGLTRKISARSGGILHLDGFGPIWCRRTRRLTVKRTSMLGKYRLVTPVS